MRRLGILGIAFAVITSAVFLTTPTSVARADLEDDLAAVERQIKDLEGRLDDAARERGGIVKDILDTQARLEAAQAEVTAAEEGLRAVRVELTSTEVRLADLEEQLAAGYEAIIETRRRIESNRGAAQDWVRRQYMRQAEGDAMGALVSASHVSDLGRIVYFLEVVTDRTTASIDRHEALQAEEERQQARIEQQEADMRAARDRLVLAAAERVELRAVKDAAAAVVSDELARQQSLLATLEATIAEFENELDGLDAEQDRLEELIRESTDPGDGGTTGELIRPVPGAITSGFGPRRHPILGYVRMHTGVDMTAPLGQDIRAAAAGRVIKAGTYGGYGSTVIIDHGGGMATLYAHQSRLLVTTGEQVAAGDVVGEVGNSGLATGPHLHFEVRINGTPVDPEDYL